MRESQHRLSERDLPRSSFESSDIAAWHTVTVAVLRSRLASLVDDRASAIVTGIDGWTAPAESMGLSRPAVVGETWEPGAPAEDVSSAHAADGAARGPFDQVVPERIQLAGTVIPLSSRTGPVARDDGVGIGRISGWGRIT